MDEAALIVSAQNGEVDAFNQLVLAHQRLVYNVAYRILGNEAGAMDATQDAFLRGYRALPKFRGGVFKAWILRIVTNCCYDQLRAMKRRPTTPLHDLVENDEHSGLLEDHRERPEAYVERQELNVVIQAGIDTLPTEQRVAVIMSDIQGLSYQEISLATMVSIGTVKSRISRGRAKLRDYLIMHRELLPNGFRLSDE